ncbi:MAG: type I 3-dehydroquinate dehydratase [Eubacteriales bacterium]|nr:type I 3-dehydroquinate dehydratase [Eubacteriales bacterium]
MTTPINVRGLLIGSGIPKICVPLTGSSLPELKTEAQNAVDAGAELVEWRADCFADLQNGKLMEYTLRELRKILREIPMIFTIRTSEEGGNILIDLKEYLKINLAAAKSKCVDFVDVQVFGNEKEKEALIRQIHEEQVKVIASSHDFQKTDPKEVLIQRFLTMDQSGADILKMAVMPVENEDVYALMLATNEVRRQYTSRPLVSMSMGYKGEISRYAGENFGSSITFATVGKASAPGQIPIAQLRLMMQKLHEENNKEKA